MADSSWLIHYGRNPAASIRLFCFHCAGGSASEFRSWPIHLPDNIELVAVQLPGREGRIKDAFILKMGDLISSIVDAMTPFLEKPYAIFGHSFGAICGFEVIRELRRRGLNQPLLFAPAGRQGPNVKDKKLPISSLPENAFIDELRKDYGDHIGSILENTELREVFMPQIHADFVLSETYRFFEGQPLDCPIVAFAGISENDLEADELNEWSAHTSRSFHSLRVPGDHFFIRKSRGLIIAMISQKIISLQYCTGSSHDAARDGR